MEPIYKTEKELFLLIFIGDRGRRLAVKLGNCIEAYKIAMRNSAICGPDLDNPEEKRDMGKAEQFRQKRRCKSIRAPTEAEIASLEVSYITTKQ